MPLRSVLMRGIWNLCPRVVDECFLDAGATSKSDRLEVAKEARFLVARYTSAQSSHY